MTAMTKYLAGVLSVIAFSLTVIAYSLVFPRVTALDARGLSVDDHPFVAAPVETRVPAYAYRASDSGMTIEPQARVVRTAEAMPAPRQVVTRTVERAPRRDWKKAVMVIGGSTAAGAGVGGLVGGKKGALIGAALAGGASTIYQTTR